MSDTCTGSSEKGQAGCAGAITHYVSLIKLWWMPCLMHQQLHIVLKRACLQPAATCYALSFGPCGEQCTCSSAFVSTPPLAGELLVLAATADDARAHRKCNGGGDTLYPLCRSKLPSACARAVAGSKAAGPKEMLTHCQAQWRISFVGCKRVTCTC